MSDGVDVRSVAALLRMHFGATGEALPALTDPIAERILAIGIENKVLGFVAGRLPRDGIAAILARYKAEILYKSNVLLSECVSLSSLLDIVEISHVFVKGPLRQYALYGDYFTRPSSDIDILIARSDFRKCRLELLRQGYAVLSPSIWWTAALGEQTLVKTGRPRLTVDLHYRLDQPGLPQPLNGSGFLSGARRVAYRGAMLPILPPTDATLLDVISFGKALFNREPSGSYVADLYASLMPDFPETVNSLLRSATAQGLEGVARVALAAVAAIFEIDPGPGAALDGGLARLSPSHWRALILTPRDERVAWPRRRELLWAYCGGGRVRYLQELGRLFMSEILRRLVERGPRRELLEES